MRILVMYRVPRFSKHGSRLLLPKKLVASKKSIKRARPSYRGDGRLHVQNPSIETDTP